MKNIFPYLSLLFLALTPACKCSTDTENTSAKVPVADSGSARVQELLPPGAPQPVPGTITASGAKELSDEMRHNLIENFDAYLYSQNERDYKTYVNYHYKPMLDIMNADTMVARVQRIDNMGWTNFINGYQIDKISPIVETDSAYIVMLRVKMQMDVVFEKKFDNSTFKSPENVGGMIRDKYPTAVYDAPARKYHIDEKMKFYCLTKKDTLDFRFLQHAYINEPKLANLLDYDTFYKLRTYEK
ncbi:MAG: hypothetical protein SH856_07660 [Flavobacteriales bacterium]|nr:hypothetical protein [Flavobacteriales bacterium]